MEGYRVDTFERGKSIYHINTNHKKASLALLLSGKVDFRARSITVDSSSSEKGQFTWKMTTVPPGCIPGNSHKFM